MKRGSKAIKRRSDALTPGAKKYTPAEVRAQLATCEQLLLRGASNQRLQIEMRDRHGVGTIRCKALMERVARQWALEDEERRPTLKAQAIRRIMRMLGHASGSQNADGTWSRSPNHQAVAKYEDLLAKIQGTYEPLQLNVDIRVSQVAAEIIYELKPEEVAELVAEHREAEELSARYKALPEAVRVQGA